MFVKIYRYKIERRDLKRWKRITVEANSIYQRHDKNFRWGRFIRKGKKFVNVVEICYYKSKKEFFNTYRKISKYKKIKKLWEEFSKIVDAKRIKEEEFESV